MQIQTHSLICSNKISRCIESLNKNRLLSIGADKINYVAKNIFDFRITTKQLKIIHSLIARSKETLHEIRYNSHSQNFFLVKTPCILNLYQKLKYIKSFAPLKLNQNNLNYYRNSSNELTSTITNLISNFFNENESCKNLYNLKLYINANLKNWESIKILVNCKNKLYLKFFFLIRVKNSLLISSLSLRFCFRFCSQLDISCFQFFSMLPILAVNSFLTVSILETKLSNLMSHLFF